MILRRRRRGDDSPFYLVSSAGVPNFGDEFITRAWLDWLATNHPDVPVWLDCIEPGRASHLFVDAHPRLKTTNTLWHLAFAGAGPSLDDGADYVQYLVRQLGSPRFDAGLEHLRSVRSVHLLGGGYVNAIWPHQILLLPALAALHDDFGVPVYATGQGLMPIGEHSASVRGWASAFELFETRDKPSAGLLDAHAGSDDAFLAFANKRPIFSPSPAPDVMILVQGDFDDESQRNGLVDRVCRYAEENTSDATVGVVEGLPPDDGWIAPLLEKRGLGVETYPFLRLWKEGLPARHGQTWLTTRFHFHLLAAAAGAAGCAVNLHPDYYGVKHESLRDLGTGWSLVQGLADSGAYIPSRSPEFSEPQALRMRGRAKADVARNIYS